MTSPVSDSQPDPETAPLPPPGPLFRLAQKLFLFKARITRGMTLGVRAVALNAKGEIFLVRHSYLAGWHLPGGGVDPGESLEDALAKELREEGHLEMTEPPALLGMYFNRAASPRDHVAVFVVRNVRQTAPRGADYEIREAGFFAVDKLPATTTEGTRRRIREALDGVRPDGHW
jgi:ADP-ribose pyrophosphatase YjhB (NUDIX family)